MVCKLTQRNGPFILGVVLLLAIFGVVTSAADERSGAPAAAAVQREAASLPITFCLRQGDNYGGADDTDIDSWLPNKTNGADGALRVRNDNARNFLIRFTLPQLPPEPNFVLGQARLRFHVKYRSASFPVRIGLYRVRRLWTAADASWIDATSDTSWNQPGCNGLPDRDQTTAVWADAFVESDWLEFDATQDVTLWMTSPSENHGYLARGEGSQTVEYQLDSSDALQSLFRPELCITYYEATPTPTITNTPTETPTPTMTPTPTPTATPNTGNIYGVVWDDRNGDGHRNAGEPPLSAVQVILRTPAGQPLTFDTTDAEGRYDLGAITPGLYWLHEVDPPGFISTTVNDWMVRVFANYRIEINLGDRLAPTATSTHTVTSTATGTETATPTSTGTTTPSATASFTPTPTPTPTQTTGSIFGRVWHDMNENGRRDPGEPPLRGVQVVLKTPAGQLMLLQITDDDGLYRLDPVVPGQYWLQELDPAGFVSTTLNDWMVYIQANRALEVDFGDRHAPTVSPTPTSPATKTGTVPASHTFTPTPTHTPTASPTSISPGTVTATASTGATRTATSSPSPTATATAIPCGDAFEPDDQPSSAKMISTDGQARQHTIHAPGDVDFSKFMGSEGMTYEIRTSNLTGAGNDTRLMLLAPDGTTILAENDDDPESAPASRITWTCLRSANYFVLAMQHDSEVGGCDITYALSVNARANTTPTSTPGSRILLPVLLRSGEQT